MVSQTVKIINKNGLHMRLSGVFAAEMSNFSCKVTLSHSGVNINGKSVMHIIASCLRCGQELTIMCDGEDEEKALGRAVYLIETGFGENEE